MTSFHRTAAIALIVTIAAIPFATAANPAFSLARVGPEVVDVAFGQAVTLSATVTNQATTTETFNVAVSTDRHVSAGAPSATSLTLAPGETGTVSVSVTLLTTSFSGAVGFKATSATSGEARLVHTYLSAPITVTLALSDSLLTITGQAVRGTVTVVDMAGQPVVGISGTVATSYEDVVPGSKVSVTTGAGGVGSFVIDGPVEHLPGTHSVQATMARPGNSDVKSNSAEYGVNPRLL